MSQIGPMLPPHLQKDRSSDSSSDEESYGPKLPSTGCKGPEKRNNQNGYEASKERTNQSGSDDSSDDDYGPSLPPHLLNQSKPSTNNTRILGPSLPAGFSLPAPVQRHSESDSDDDDVIGPRLPTQSLTAGQSVALDMEERARRMKDKLEGKDQQKEPERETWMLELPSDQRKNFGMGARQFSRKGHLGPEKGGDRSAWTDSPAEKERKEREGIKSSGGAVDETPPVDQFVRKRDMKMEEMTEELNKKRGNETLMEKHEKKLKKKAKKEEAAGLIQERRPFDRDLDLKANHFDEAQRKAMMKKTGSLGDRYASGGQKFL